MKVLHLTNSGTGGAYVAAQRISDSLNKIGHDSRVEVLSDKIYCGVNVSKLQAKIDFANEKLSSAPMTTSITRSYSSSKSYFEDLSDIDVVNLHWVPGILHQAFIDRVSDVNRVVWTMHDMNVFTGICHHTSGCRRFEKNCQSCPQFTIPMIQVPGGVLRQKKRYIEQLGIASFIAPSEWIKGEALASDLLCEKSIDVVPNPTNNNLIASKPKLALKSIIGLRSDKPIFAILGANYGEQKGGRRALQEIIEFNSLTGMEIQVVILGQKFPMAESIKVVSTMDYPQIPFEDVLQVCDLYIHLSEFENLPNIIIEAQSLGVPVLALDRGGVCETLLNGVTGLTIKNLGEFCGAMKWFFSAPRDRNFADEIRDFAKNKFEQTKIASAYLEIYSR